MIRWCDPLKYAHHVWSDWHVHRPAHVTYKSMDGSVKVLKVRRYLRRCARCGTRAWFNHPEETKMEWRDTQGRVWQGARAWLVTDV